MMMLFEENNNFNKTKKQVLMKVLYLIKNQVIIFIVTFIDSVVSNKSHFMIASRFIREFEIMTQNMVRFNYL